MIGKLSLTTTIQILGRDSEATDKAPKVLQEKAKASSPSGSRSYSTSARKQQEAIIRFEDQGIEGLNHNFDLPELPLGPREHFRYRYDPVVKQITMLLMRDGKLATAQRVCSTVLLFLASN